MQINNLDAGHALWQPWMDMAYEQACRAYAQEEVPVGAVLLDGDHKLLAAGYNSPISQNDPTAHAEILVLREGGQIKGNYRLNGCILVTTLEPCLMCLGASVQARIEGLVFAARDQKNGAICSRIDFQQHLNWLNHSFWVIEGVGREKCSRILQEFFRKKR